MVDQTRRQWLSSMAVALTATSLPSCRMEPPSDEFDVCIVGSGPAGAALAVSLAERGFSALLLEGGDRPTRPPQETSGEPLSIVAQRQPIAYPVERTRFQGVGGTSNLWGGECPRFQPTDFDSNNPYVPDGAVWPITYAEIEPYYNKAESALDIEGGDRTPSSPPRSVGFALQAPRSESVECARRLLGSAGVMSELTPRSRTPRMTDSHLPRLQAMSNATFRPNTRVTAIVAERKGRVAHLEVRNSDNSRERIRARFYVLACGGIETPGLLLRARSRTHPRGLANASDVVGRYFMEHLSLDLATLKLPTGSGCTRDREVIEVISWEFCKEFKAMGLGNALFEFALRPATSTLRISTILEMMPNTANRVSLSDTQTDRHGDPATTVTVQISDRERQTWAHAQTVGRRIADAMGARQVTPANGMFQWCHHHMGTCRMGRDARNSVVDRDLRVHDLDNLYVSGSATFVTGSVGSPTLLLTALTLRLADHLAARLGSA